MKQIDISDKEKIIDSKDPFVYSDNRGKLTKILPKEDLEEIGGILGKEILGKKIDFPDYGCIEWNKGEDYITILDVKGNKHRIYDPKDPDFVKYFARDIIFYNDLIGWSGGLADGQEDPRDVNEPKKKKGFLTKAGAVAAGAIILGGALSSCIDGLNKEDSDTLPNCLYKCSNGRRVKCGDEDRCNDDNFNPPYNKILKEKEKREREKWEKEFGDIEVKYECPNTKHLGGPVHVSDRGSCAQFSNPIIDNVFPPHVSDEFLENMNFLEMYFDDERVVSLDTDHDGFEETKLMYDKSDDKLNKIYKLNENDENAIVLYFSDDGDLERYKEAKRVLGYSRDDVYIFFSEKYNVWMRRCSELGVINPYGTVAILGKATGNINYFDFKRKQWDTTPFSVSKEYYECPIKFTLGSHKFGEGSIARINRYKSIDDQNKLLETIKDGIVAEGNKYLSSLGSGVTIEDVEITDDYDIGRIKINKELTKGVYGDIILSQDDSGLWKVDKGVSIDEKEFMTIDGKIDKNKVAKRAILTGLSLYTGEKFGYGVRDVYLSEDRRTATVELSQAAVSGTNIGSTKITMIKKDNSWIPVSYISPIDSYNEPSEKSSSYSNFSDESYQKSSTKSTKKSNNIPTIDKDDLEYPHFNIPPNINNKDPFKITLTYIPKNKDGTLHCIDDDILLWAVYKDKDQWIDIGTFNKDSSGCALENAEAVISILDKFNSIEPGEYYFAVTDLTPKTTITFKLNITEK